MLSLLDVPEELLVEIAELVVPTSIEAFSFCCRHIYRIASRSLHNHNRMKRSCSILDCGFNNQWHPAYALKRVLTDPHFAYYPVEARLGCRSSCVCIEPSLLFDSASTTKMAVTIEDCITRVSSKTSSNFARQWLHLIANGFTEPIIALLVMLLPNLHTLALQGSINEGQHIALGLAFVGCQNRRIYLKVFHDGTYELSF